jgi:hypothetical protein
MLFVYFLMILFLRSNNYYSEKGFDAFFTAFEPSSH